MGELLGAVQVLFGHQGPLPSEVFELRHLTDGGSDDWWRLDDGDGVSIGMM